MLFLSLLPYKITYFYFYGSYQLASLSQDTVSAFITVFHIFEKFCCFTTSLDGKNHVQEEEGGCWTTNNDQEFRETKISGFPRAL